MHSRRLTAAIAVLTVALFPLGPRAFAQEGDSSRGNYATLFGGGGGGSAHSITQQGTALYPAGKGPMGGGPLSVNASGNPGEHGAGVGGLGIGHEWAGRPIGEQGWGILPAVEIEGYYLGTTQNATLINPTPRIVNHTFADSFPINAGVFMADALIGLRTPRPGLVPYAGVGFGAAFVTVAGATSAQINPLEAGINHFNGYPNSSAWGFATQARAGLRFDLTRRCYLFTEYRFLFIDSTDFTFGSTQYATHIPTTPWSVHIGNMFEHLAIGGIGFRF